MLGSRLHSKSSSPTWNIAIPRSLVLLILVILHFINGANVAAQQLVQNITTPVTSSQIIYTPFVCNASTELDDPQLCSGAWRLASNNKSVSTSGPTSSSGNILPKLFFAFRASRLTIIALPSSNASVNLTISAGSVEISTIFNSSLGAVSIVGLKQNQTTILTITYITSAEQRTFALDSFVITVPENAPASSIFPTPTLPLSTPASTSSTSSSSSSVTAVPKSTSRKTMINEAVGITIGLGLGLTAIAVGLFYYWKRRKQRLNNVGIEGAKSEWSEDSEWPDAETRFLSLGNHLSRISARISARVSRSIIPESRLQHTTDI